MAGIGNYIHARNKNYKAFGTTYRGPGNNYQSRMATIRKNVVDQSIVAKSNVDGLEKFLNWLLYPVVPEQSKSIINNEAGEKAMALARQIFQEKWAGFDINKNNLSVYHNQQWKISNSLSYSQVDTLVNRFNLAINSLNKKNNSIANIELLKNTIEQLKGVLNNFSQQEKLNIQITDTDLINSINKCLSLLSWNTTMVGDSFEMWLAAVGTVLDKRANQEAAELIRNNIKSFGSATSSVKIDLSDFDDDLVDIEKIVGNVPMPHGQFEYSATKNKADVSLIWKGNPLMISAKNYSMRNADEQTVHLLSGTSTFTMLARSGVDFANHYLNIVGTRDSALEAAHTEFKKLILFRALTGEGLGKTGTADTFIINMRAKQHIYVFTMADLYNALIGHVDNPNVVQFKGFADPDNNWEGTNIPNEQKARQRITAMLAQLHAQKLVVSAKIQNIV